jgi:hypothetical protein
MRDLLGVEAALDHRFEDVERQFGFSRHSIPPPRRRMPDGAGSGVASRGLEGYRFGARSRFDLTWLFRTKRCERMSLERSLSHAEEEV